MVVGEKADPEDRAVERKALVRAIKKTALQLERARGDDDTCPFGGFG